MRVARYASRYAQLIRSYLPECIIGAYMCPWLPEEYGGALRRIFAQDYDLLAESIDVFTPLIYCTKSGRDNEWGRKFLEAAPGFIPAGRPVQLILDALEYPASLLAAAGSAVPSWGMQIFDGGRIFADPVKAGIFARAVGKIREKLEGTDCAG